MVTRNGVVKRLPAGSLKNLRNNGIRALSMTEDDRLITVRETDGEQNILIATHDGMAVCFHEDDVRPMGRAAVGVLGIKLREGDYVVGAARAQSGKAVLTITEKGYGKRTPVEEYRITKRNAYGIKNYMLTEKTGQVVGIKVVDGSEDLLLVTEAGILIRTPVEAIKQCGRSTQGVIVMRFKEEGDRVISMALADREEAPASGEAPSSEVTIYTDGACSGNPGPGGWGAILMYGEHKKELSGGEAQTTNNRMELTAVITALEALREPCVVELWSDSKYVIDGLSKGWAKGWRARGWVKGDKKPALNPDLWGRLLDLAETHTLRYHWVKGHAENEFNNRCDEMAVAESRKFK